VICVDARGHVVNDGQCGAAQQPESSQPCTTTADCPCSSARECAFADHMVCSDGKCVCDNAWLGWMCDIPRLNGLSGASSPVAVPCPAGVVDVAGRYCCCCALVLQLLRAVCSEALRFYFMC
jgi:hypothetical protein